MRSLIAGAAVVVVVVLVVVGTSKGDLGPTLAAGTPNPLKEIPLVQAWHGHFTITMAKPFRVQLPPNLGLALTEIETVSGGSSFYISVNGMLIRSNTYLRNIPTNPPIVVPPGGTLEFACPRNSTATKANIGGYFLTLVDLGM